MTVRVGDVANLDVERESRTGIPEVVLAEGKLDGHLRQIVSAFAAAKGRVLVSRIPAERVQVLDGLGLELEHHEDARFLIASLPGTPAPAKTGGRVAVVAAGTADVAVAEEARLVAEELGCHVLTAYDVGVAGIHRLFPVLDRLQEADVDVIIVAAGREGALAPVVSGLVSVPVIGLPVSVGYGFGAAGMAALQTMLQSCSPLTVVNIDAGFVAGATAAQFANRVQRARSAGVARKAEAPQAEAREAAADRTRDATPEA